MVQRKEADKGEREGHRGGRFVPEVDRDPRAAPVQRVENPLGEREKEGGWAEERKIRGEGESPERQRQKSSPGTGKLTPFLAYPRLALSLFNCILLSNFPRGAIDRDTRKRRGGSSDGQARGAAGGSGGRDGDAGSGKRVEGSAKTMAKE